MPKYRVLVKYNVTEIYEIEADSKEHAMNMLEGPKYYGLFEPIKTEDSDPEIYYPDIEEIK